MKKLTFATLLICICAFGQKSTQFSNEIKTLLGTKSENSWGTCNDDNRFFRNDTIYFQTKLEADKCLKWVSWNFKSKNSFVQNSSQWVNGTHATIGSRITNYYDNYKFTIKTKNGSTILTTYRNGQKAESFRVIDLNLAQQNKLITLVRIRTSP